MALDGYSDVVYDAIRAHVDTNWTAAPIRWPNENWEDAPGGSWIAFEIFGSSYGQQTVGETQQTDNRWDQEGYIWFHVMVPRGTGTTNARGAAKALANLFRGKRLLPAENLEFMDATIGPGAPGDEEGNYFRTSVAIEWRHWQA